MQVWHVYVAMFVRALGGAFHWPAMQASTSLMVPKDQLSRVAGVNQMLHGILNIVSPPLGALLMSTLPLHGIMGIDVGTAAFAIVPLFFIRIPQPARQDGSEHSIDTERSRGMPSPTAGAGRTLWRDVKEGFLYIWHWPGMSILLGVATVLNLFINPGFSLLPILVTRHFGGNVLQLGWMNAAWGVGVVFGGLTLGVWGGFRRKIVTSLLGLFGLGAGILVVGLAPATAFWMAWGWMVLAGFSNPIVNGPFFAILQDVVDPKLQGRVFTVIGSLSAAASPLGMAFAGPAADRWRVQVWFILGGGVSLLMGIGMPFVHAVMHLEDHKTSAGEATSSAQRASVASSPV